jgi:hypothetical protein
MLIGIFLFTKSQKIVCPESRVQAAPAHDAEGGGIDFIYLNIGL